MSYQIEPNIFSDCLIDRESLLYLAGLFDGEGSIYLVGRKTKGRRSHHFSPEMTIANSNWDLLRFVRTATGNGRIMLNRRPTSSNHKQVGVWQLAPRQIRHILPQLEPVLIAKRRQAQLVMEYLAIQTKGARPDGMGRTLEADIPRVLEIHEELRQLNRRGMEEGQPLQFSIAESPGRRERHCQQQGCDSSAYRSEEFCYKHFLLRRDPIHKICEECGDSFTAIMEKKRFCTPRCQWRNSLKRRDTSDAEHQKTAHDQRKGETNPRVSLTAEQVKDIATRYALGNVSQRALAQDFRVQHSTIGRIVRGRTWRSVEKADATSALESRKFGEVKAHRGEAAGRKVLTAAKVQEIRRRFAAGETNKAALARDYGVDRTNIDCVVRRKTWTHIE